MRGLSCWESVELRVENLDPDRRTTTSCLQRGDERGDRLFAISREQAPGQGLADDVRVGALGRVPSETQQVPRPQGAPSTSCPAEKRDVGVPSFANASARRYDWCIVQLHSGDPSDHS